MVFDFPVVDNRFLQLISIALSDRLTKFAVSFVFQ